MIFSSFKMTNPLHIALRDKEQSISYGDLLPEIKKRAAQLDKIFLLGLDLDNSVEWVLWDLAALYKGVPTLPLPPFFNDQQKIHALKSAGASHVLNKAGLHELAFKNDVDLPKGTAKITFTSGSTGAPKGVCLSKENLEKTASSIVQLLGDEFKGIHVSILPFGVLLENVAGVYSALMAGSTIEIPSLNDFGTNYINIHHVLKSTGCNTAIIVPEILKILAFQTMKMGAIESLTYVALGGSKTSPSMIEIAQNLNIPVYEGYGLSECGSVVSLNTPSNNKIGSVGKLLPHLKAIIDDGEIVITNPNSLGYIGQTPDRCLKTGDIGSFDKDGYLHVSGRSKNVLITSYGRNVSPEWVESSLLGQGDIAQAIVYGDAEVALSAFIVPSHAQANITQAVEQANQSLPDYAHVKNFQIVPPFTIQDGTLTGTGRPKRQEILKLYERMN